MERLQPSWLATKREHRGYQLSVGLIFGLSVGLIGGLIFGLIFGLSYGGEAVIQHYALRSVLAYNNILPYPFRDKRLIAYLDAMAERVLLRRVGGGWIFIHRYLLEYFAEQHPDCRPTDE